MVFRCYYNYILYECKSNYSFITKELFMSKSKNSNRIKFSAVRKLSGSGRLQGINIEYKGKILHFKPPSIQVGQITAHDKFMSSVTAFLDNFSDADHKALFDVYLVVQGMRDAVNVTTHSMFDLDEAIETLFDMITLERIQAWGREWKGYVNTSALSENMTPMRSGVASSACTPVEYIDICILSTLFKILIPFQEISSHIADVSPNVVVDHWSLFKLLDTAGGISSYPAYQKFLDKAIAKSELELGKGVPVGLTAKGIGEEAYYKIVLIPKLFRDVTRLETEVATVENGARNNISFKVNGAIDNRIVNDIKKSYQFSRTLNTPGTEEREGNTTFQEKKPGGERISSMYSTLFEADYCDLISILEHAEEFPKDFKIPKEEVLELIKLYPPNAGMSNAQAIVSGLIIHDVIPINAQQFRPKKEDVVQMAYVALIAKKFNLPNLYRLLTCVEDFQGQLTESDLRNSVHGSPIVHPSLPAVTALYPDEHDSNPFAESINALIFQIVRTNFVIGVPDDEAPLGEEWSPKIINDWGIKDELVDIIGRLNGVIK